MVVPGVVAGAHDGTYPPPGTGDEMRDEHHLADDEDEVGRGCAEMQHVLQVVIGSE